MPNSNYISGRSFEHRVRKEYEQRGYYVIRAAGSKGFWDLVALDKRRNSVVCIQCKVCKRKAHVKQLIKEVKTNNPFPTGLYTQVLAVRIKGESTYEKIYLDE